jgi:hypothetical protein
MSLIAQSAAAWIQSAWMKKFIILKTTKNTPGQFTA